MARENQAATKAASKKTARKKATRKTARKKTAHHMASPDEWRPESRQPLEMAPQVVLGRPSKYPDVWTEENKRSVLEMFASGAYLGEVAAFLGIDRSTLYAWADDPGKADFSNTLRQGIALAEAWWESKGRTHLEAPRFQQGLYALHMANKFKWDTERSYQQRQEPPPQQSVRSRIDVREIAKKAEQKGRLIEGTTVKALPDPPGV